MSQMTKAVRLKQAVMDLWAGWQNDAEIPCCILLVFP
jgi:hypothetical protein